MPLSSIMSWAPIVHRFQYPTMYSRGGTRSMACRNACRFVPEIRAASAPITNAFPSQGSVNGGASVSSCT